MNSSKLRTLAVQTHVARLRDIDAAALTDAQRTLATVYSEALLSRDLTAANARATLERMPHALDGATVQGVTDTPAVSHRVAVDFRAVDWA